MGPGIPGEGWPLGSAQGTYAGASPQHT